MRYPWLDEYLLQKPGVTKDLQPEWNWIRYKLGDKMFAAICLSDAGKAVYITLKLEPSEGEFLRQQYPDIIPVGFGRLQQKETEVDSGRGNEEWHLIIRKSIRNSICRPKSLRS